MLLKLICTPTNLIFIIWTIKAYLHASVKTSLNGIPQIMIDYNVFGEHLEISFVFFHYFFNLIHVLCLVYIAV